MSTVPPTDGATLPHLEIEVPIDSPVVWLIVVALLLATALFVWALLQAAQRPAPIALVLALSVLSLTAIGAALLTGNGDFVTLAATGIGALAGAVSATYHHQVNNPEPPQEVHHDPDS